jgi:transcriptional regulator with XRE-family HTH domain
MITKVNLVKRCSMSIEVFAKRARELRNGKGLTTRMLAAELGISCALISYYENCKREPTLSALKAYAKFFNVTIDYLAGLSDRRNNNG